MHALLLTVRREVFTVPTCTETLAADITHCVAEDVAVTTLTSGDLLFFRANSRRPRNALAEFLDGQRRQLRGDALIVGVDGDGFAAPSPEIFDRLEMTGVFATMGEGVA